ncbi:MULTISPECIES: hypothetical protein [Pseudomonas]|uniref:Uncharacterized protein n=1 Tax=Pseudomonas frederiksbergensis TaxID=104087 RepID=A0A2S8HC62_9PSED|nr:MULTISPECIES: hypothetical protein [Pseudomonas]PQP00107.1 hypothetical protein C5612_24505 [Pseudomonas frederiksbergensis]WLG49622.1 hypothetical protein PSH64_23295 [Pseudomonas sp. FP1742]
MKTNQFVGKCSGKSQYNGNPVGTEFFTEEIQFAMNFYAAQKGQDFVQIFYGQSLEAGDHELKVGPEEEAKLEYKVGNIIHRPQGTVKVMVSSDLDKQVGTFDASYLDGIGRPILFKGEFEGQYFLK